MGLHASAARTAVGALVLAVAGAALGEEVGLANDPYWKIILEGEQARSHTVRDGSGSIGPATQGRAQQAQANIEASYTRVREYLADGRLDMRRVLEINRSVRQGISTFGAGQGGQRRTGRMPIGDVQGAEFVRYTGARNLPGEAAKLDALLKWSSSGNLTRPQAIRAAADAHHAIVQNHLFADGNGRTARLVSDWILMRNGLPPADHAAIPAREGYIFDRTRDPKATQREFREYMEKAVSSAETKVGRGGVAPGETAGGRTQGRGGARTGNTATEGIAPEGVTRTGGRSSGGSHGGPGGPVTGVRGGGPTPMELVGVQPGTQPDVTPRPAGARTWRAGVSVATMAGLQVGSELVRQGAHGEDLDVGKAAKTLATPEFIGGWGGFIVGERVAASVLSSLIPVPGVGKLIGKPLAQMAIRGTAGVAAGHAVGSVAGGHSIDPVDLVGSSVASGVGMAVGQALIPIPGVGAIVGGIVGGLAWELGYSFFSSRKKTRRGQAPAPRMPRTPVPATRGWLADHG